jgi:2-isopropylmalate synthase
MTGAHGVNGTCVLVLDDWKKGNTVPRIANNPGKWFTNALNFAPEVTADWSPPAQVGILDSTVRKITGTPGSRYNPEDVAELCQIADALGVKWIEVNLVHGPMPSSPKLRAMFNAIAKRKHKFMLVGTAFLNKETIDHAIDNGADAVSIGLGPDLDEARKWHEYAKSKGVKVTTTLGARVEHLPLDEVIRLVNRAASTDVEYIGIHEDTGATSPDAWRYLMKQITQNLTRDVPVIPHIHNMYGQGTGAAVNAVLGGARGIDLTMNGIAIHCGMPAIEEVVACLEIYHGVDTGIDMSLFREYSTMLSRVFRLGVHPNKAITGEKAFIEELEPFVEEFLLDRAAGRPRVFGFSPRIFGTDYFVAWGENTVHGPASKVKLQQMGLPHDDASVKQMTDALEAALADKEARDDYPYYLTEEEFEALARGVFAQEPAATSAG